ncbi:8278_t:CDS:1, partial [Dentiscutata erythropus]
NNNFNLNYIANMNKTPVCFDIVGVFTLDNHSVQSVLICITDNNKNQFTCVLEVIADKLKLLSIIIFKEKRILKGNYPLGVVVRV